MGSAAERIMINNDIKEVIAKAKEAGATVVNDATIKDVSFSVAAESNNVDYWATLTLDTILPGMVGVGAKDSDNHYDSYVVGKTRTVMVPLGTVVTCLFDALNDLTDNDDAFDLCDYKKIVITDAHKEAQTRATKTPYVSQLHKLVRGTKISVVCREVHKEDGTVKSLFSLNEREHEVKNDSIWHDIYGLNGIREKSITNALAFCEDANKAAQTTDEKTAKASAYDGLLAQFARSAQANMINSVLG